MDVNAINQWAQQLGRINYHAGRLAHTQNSVCLRAMQHTADLLEAVANASDALELYSPPMQMGSPPMGYFALPVSPTPASPRSVPMQREDKVVTPGLGLRWAPNLTPRDEPDNPFSPRSRPQ